MFGAASKDVRTTTGRNIWCLQQETDFDSLRSNLSKVKEVLGSKLVNSPDRDRWRINYLGKLLEERGAAYYDGKDHEDLTVLIDSLCCN